MFRRFKRSLAIMLSVVSVLAYYTVPASAAVGLYTDASVTLGDVRPETSTTYAFSLKSATELDLQGIMISFRTSPTGGTVPDKGAWATAVKSGAFSGIGTDANWSVDVTDAAAGNVFLTKSAGENIIGAGGTYAFTLGGIKNPEISADGCATKAGDLNSSAGTCYITVSSYTTSVVNDMKSGTPVDSTTISYTISNNVEVTAKVDPAFSFVIAGVNASTTVNKLDGGAGGVVTSATSTYNTLPFGNLQPGNKKYLAQNLTVNTNASKGYTVSMKMTQVMTGIYLETIDQFAAPGASWTTPVDWVSPTSSGPNDMGWLGAATTDVRSTGWDAANQGKWGPLGTASDLVMNSPGPELNKTSQVSFILDVDVYQPSDLYTGTLQYNCVPKY